MDIFSIIIIQTLHGIVYGMLLFLVAAGLTLVWGMMGVLNIANAAFYMLGAFLTYSVVAKAGNYWLSLILVPAVVGVNASLFLGEADVIAADKISVPPDKTGNPRCQ